jgi:shikimate kinase
MSRGERIFITGFMAAGKTTVAAALAQRLDWPMLDLDQFIAEREGRSIGSIIEEEGEARFREIEERALCEALENDAARIIALGGGTWTSERNRAAIAEHNALTIWLDAPFELCWQRITGDQAVVRPIAQDFTQARRLYDSRREQYKLADLRIAVSAKQSALMIVAKIESSIR